MNLQYQIYALYGIVLILIVYNIFQQRRSYFTPSQGAPISMMDLEEYAKLTQPQKDMYRSMLSSNATILSTSMYEYPMFESTLQRIRSSIFMKPNPTSTSTTNTQPTSMPTTNTQSTSTTNTQSNTTSTAICKTVSVMGDCLLSDRCPDIMSRQTVNTKAYCVCPPAKPYLKKSLPSSTPMCSDVPCSTSERTITESATGQRACVPSCPPILTGYTCT